MSESEWTAERVTEEMRRLVPRMTWRRGVSPLSASTRVLAIGNDGLLDDGRVEQSMLVYALPHRCGLLCDYDFGNDVRGSVWSPSPEGLVRTIKATLEGAIGQLNDAIGLLAVE